MIGYRPTRRAARKEEGGGKDGSGRRLTVVAVVFCLVGAAIAVRLFMLQVVSYPFYSSLAANSHDVLERLTPVRGNILIRDSDGNLYPVATNRDTYQVYAEPRNVKDPQKAAELLAPMLVMDQNELQSKLTGNGLYAPLTKGVSEDLKRQLVAVMDKDGVTGIQMSREPARVYPEAGMGGHVLGFVGSDANGDRSGRYGIEGYWDKELAGTPGFIAAEQDVGGRMIPLADNKISPATDGASIVLTIDRTVQFFVCSKLKETVAAHGATGGSAIVYDPKTGAVIAMCGDPDFDPNDYSNVQDISVYNNPATFGQYEPGSVIKAVTMAIAVDQGKVGPKTTYTDEGELKFGPFTIKNSDGKANGVQTMTNVLEKSLNTGAVFAAEQVGLDVFRDYFSRFGFGKKTGIELDSESPGDLSALQKKGEIYMATASFGQGITVTPIQLAAAYGAIANHGVLMKPRIVDSVIWSPTHTETKEPVEVGQVISDRAAALVSGMLVSVVENGHGKKAAVPGYWVAGKTGTAQIPRTDGPGYMTDFTIGTFAGFAPVDDPKFVVVVRIDKPDDTAFAETSAAPLFGEIAKFLLQYYHVQPTRPIAGQ